jgi:hypothetical protein
MAEPQQAGPIVLLFDEYGRPLMVKMPYQKQPIGFINGTKPKPQELKEAKDDTDRR